MSLFREGVNQNIQTSVLTLLNAGGEALGLTPRSSPRSVGDSIQDYLSQNLQNILPNDLLDEYASEFSRRAMADVAFKDRDGNYYVVDIKTHCLSTKFNMPNLISVERLSRFYKESSNNFAIMYVAYDLTDNGWSFSECKFVPIEYLDWSCLTIGALGWGQIQIANANIINIVPQSRRKWMLALCEVLLDFYPREMGKIENRLTHFQTIRERWLARAED
jgi:hypothetical protein